MEQSEQQSVLKRALTERLEGALVLATSLPACDLPSLDTAIETAAAQAVEAYIAALPMDPGTPDAVQTLIAGHVRSFYAWLMSPAGAAALVRAVWSAAEQ